MGKASKVKAPKASAKEAPKEDDLTNEEWAVYGKAAAFQRWQADRLHGAKAKAKATVEAKAKATVKAKAKGKAAVKAKAKAKAPSEAASMPTANDILRTVTNDRKRVLIDEGVSSVVDGFSGDGERLREVLKCEIFSSAHIPEGLFGGLYVFFDDYSALNNRPLNKLATNLFGDQIGELYGPVVLTQPDDE